MHQIDLEDVPPAVHEFFASLPIGEETIEFLSRGQIVGTFPASGQLTEAERDALLSDGWELLRRTQQRNRGVPPDVIAREVNEAVEQVRSRKRR